MRKIGFKKLFIVLTLGFVIINSNTFIDKIGAQADKIYNKIRLFTEVFTMIKSHYVKEMDSKDLVYGAAKGMVGTLDPFSQFMPPDDYKKIKVKTEGAFGGLGIRISIKDSWLTVITPLPGTPAYKVGILPGDKIIKIEGESTRGITLNDSVKKLRGKPGTKVTITVSRVGEKDKKDNIDFTIIREKIKVESVIYRMLDTNIAYIRLTEFSGKTVKDFDKAMKDIDKQGATSLILDLRNNPGGLLGAAVDVCKYFIGDNKIIVYTQGRKKENRVDFKAESVSRHKYLPLVLLVNKGSASGSEIVAGAIKDWARGIVLGSQTFGKGSVQTVLKLSDGAGLRLTTAKYYTPSGVCIHDIGVKPDIVLDIKPELAMKLMAQEDAMYIDKLKETMALEKEEIKKKDKLEDKLEGGKQKEDTLDDSEKNNKDKASKKESKEKEYTEDPQLKQAISLIKARSIFFNVEKSTTVIQSQ